VIAAPHHDAHPEGYAEWLGCDEHIAARRVLDVLSDQMSLRNCVGTVRRICICPVADTGRYNNNNNNYYSTKRTYTTTPIYLSLCLTV